MSAYLNTLREEATREELLRAIENLLWRLEEEGRRVSELIKGNKSAPRDWDRGAAAMRESCAAAFAAEAPACSGPEYEAANEFTQEWMRHVADTAYRRSMFVLQVPIPPAPPGHTARAADKADHPGFVLTFDALRRANVVRQAEWCPDQKPDLSFRANELAGEAGETCEAIEDLCAALRDGALKMVIAVSKACNTVKKLERERHVWVGSRAALDHLADELADAVTCCDLVGMKVGIDLGAAVAARFNAASEARGLETRLSSHTEDRP